MSLCPHYNMEQFECSVSDEKGSRCPDNEVCWIYYKHINKMNKEKVVK